MEERALETAEGRIPSGSRRPNLRDAASASSQNHQNRQSVHGVVASLIRAAEETRFKATDRPVSLHTKKPDGVRSTPLQQVAFFSQNLLFISAFYFPLVHIISLSADAADKLCQCCANVS